jgi:hypothetical protein
MKILALTITKRRAMDNQLSGASRTFVVSNHYGRIDSSPLHPMTLQLRLNTGQV